MNLDDFDRLPLNQIIPYIEAGFARNTVIDNQLVNTCLRMNESRNLEVYSSTYRDGVFYFQTVFVGPIDVPETMRKAAKIMFDQKLMETTAQALIEESRVAAGI